MKDKNGKSSNSISGDENITNGGHLTINNGRRYPLSVLNKQNAETGLHPTQKPVALMEYLIKTYTNEGETVLDFAMGSGTTGVACQNLNRQFIGIEYNPTEGEHDKFYNIGLERIKKNGRK